MVKLPVEVVSTTCAPGVAVPETRFVPTGCVLLLAGERMATIGGARAVKLVVVVEQPPDVQAVTVSVFGPVGTFTVQENIPVILAVVTH